MKKGWQRKYRNKQNYKKQKTSKYYLRKKGNCRN